VTDHATSLTLFDPVRPELLFDSFDVFNQVSAIFLHVLLLRKVQRNVQELNKMAKLKTEAKSIAYI
jgi:hypothetical protein